MMSLDLFDKCKLLAGDEWQKKSTRNKLLLILVKFLFPVETQWLLKT